MSKSNISEYAFNEMLSHVPLCTYPRAENILILGTCEKDFKEDFKNELQKHKAKVSYKNIDKLSECKEKSFDVIIVTQKFELSKEFIDQAYKILNADGLITFLSTSYFDDIEKLKNDLLLSGEAFWIAMPFSFGHTTAVLASKKYHPTADIVLQTSDLLQDLKYYNSELQLASFVHPSFVNKELLGFAKR